MEQRLERSDIRLLLGCAGLALVSLVVGTHFFYDAFPEATIDFDITRHEARHRAASFLEHRGFDFRDYRHAAVFRFDDETKTFLERELGLEGASAMLGDPVRLWRWSNRWFRELQKEEFRVEHTTTGQLVGFRHLVEEEATGARLSREEARALASQFLSQVIGVDLATVEFVDAEVTRRPNRVDHDFTWKLTGFDVAGASYRYRVGVQGDLVGSYEEFLKVPDAWRRGYQELRSRNEVTGLVAGLLMFLLWLAMLARLVYRIRTQDVRWRAVFAFAGVAFVLTFLHQLNSLPVTVFGFDTTDSYGSFLTRSILVGLATALAAAIGIGFVVAGGEPEYRRWYGGHISVSEQFLPDGIRTKRFLIGTVVGLTLAAVAVTYEILFYLLADRLGAWSPAQIPYAEMVNTHIPWVVVLLVGFLPAVSEEFTSRAFAIPFLHRLLKFRWAAIVVAALVWGFAHANYPQQPFWIRGVEVGLIGIGLGYVFVRWGLLPVLVWHYTYNGLLTALILLRSSNPYFVLSSAVSVGLMLLPLGVAVALYFRSRFFVDPESLLNREDAPVLAAERAAPAAELSPEAQILAQSCAVSTYQALSRARLGAGAVAVLVLLVVFAFEAPEGAVTAHFALSREQARDAAERHLAETGVDVAGRRVVVTPETPWDGHAVDYRHERGGPAVAVAPYLGDLAPALWRARFFQPQVEEEWTVRLWPHDGSVYEVRHRLAEDAPGADLTEEAARAIAAEHLRRYGYDPERFVVKEASTEALPARRDHWFEWEAAPADARNLDESRFRCRVHVAGEKPAGLHRYIKLPEDWLRARREGTLWRTVLRAAPLAVVLAVTVHLLWVLVARIRAGEVTWRLALRLGAAAAALTVVGAVNGLPSLYAGYPTQIPEAMYVTGRLIAVVLIVVVLGLLVAAAVGLYSSLFPVVVERLRPASLRAQLRDAVLLSALAVGGGLAADRLGRLLAAALPEGAPAPTPEIADVAAFWPWVAALLQAVQSAFLQPLAAATGIYYAVRVLHRPSVVVLVILCVGAAVAGADAHRPAQFFYGLAAFGSTAAVAAAAIYWLFRDNVAAYVLTGFLAVALDSGWRLATQPAFAVHGWIVLGGAAAVVLVLGVLSVRPVRAA